tara:strand:- start:2824 stop:3432 length:609 start_codon:yes stop_codon:yes gene_type:complete
MLRLSERHPLALGAYALAAILALFELAILWQALHPRVPDDYRAYYIDRTTTCLAQPVTGAYQIGTEIDFRSGGPDTRELRPCGWDGPAGDGMHSIGQTSRLRFAVERPQALTLMLELSGVTITDAARQRVIVSAGGIELGTLNVPAGQPGRFTLAVPPQAIAADGMIDIALDFPDAVNPGGRTANTHWRAVKLTAASLSPQP